MRLNRKWLYLGGLITILTLLLTLTWVLPVSADSHWDAGTVAVDKDYVSPDNTNITDPDDREVTVTLSGTTLDSNLSVKKNGDIESVRIEIGENTIPVITTGSFRVQISNESSSIGDATVDRPPDAADTDLAAARVLPIIGEVTVDTSPTATKKAVAAKVGNPTVVNAVTGLIEIPVKADLLDGDIIYLSYMTSPQETAMVNVEGDSGVFDLVLVEDAAGPAGEYDGTFVVAETVTLNIGMAAGDGPIDEQHRVLPSGLEGYKEIEDQIIPSTNRYVGVAGDNTLPTTLTTLGDGATGTFWSRLPNHPILAANGTHQQHTL